MVQYRIEVEDDELWDDFKGTVPRNRTINDVLVEMIEERVDD
ncbi:hypothetical protein [Natrarchaeobaculum sulfurireducens]|nr:hypothetical protein [Natrarchaeobaculum sulfurireducens]